VIRNRNYNGLTVESKIIHSYNNSGVEFDFFGFSGKKTKAKAKRELGDMVIISLVTFGGEIVLLKTAFIQNKDSIKSPEKWNINREQLFLLKNFPTFTGTRGIFKGQTVTFLNHSGSLGNYGLFWSNGEMTFLTARNVFLNQQNTKRIDTETISYTGIKRGAVASLKNHCSRYKKCYDFNDYNCFEYYAGCNLPFFGNYSFALDIHEVVRELTYFNIGEPSRAFGNIKDNKLYEFTCNLLQSVFGYSINEGHFNRDSRGQIPNGFEDSIKVVVLNHLTL